MERLSSRLANRHKWIQTWLSPTLIIIGAIIFILSNFDSSKPLPTLNIAVLLGIAAYTIHLRGRKLQEVSYDNSNIYIRQNQQEEIIPLSSIKNVELKSLFGGYQVDFYQINGQAGHILFLPSSWYPLNFRSQDKKVEEFRVAIAKAKRLSMATHASRGLHSLTA